MNERITENIVRNFLQKQNYYDNPDIIVDEQKSSIPQIDKLLQNASKKGSGKGYPEFIIKSKSINNFVIVIECKYDITMTRKTVLTRLELIRMATFMQLNDNYDAVMIVQNTNNGVGPTTWARFFKTAYPDRYQEIEVTDLETW